MALSTASVYPESVEAAFELAAELGYDGIELMVWSDRVSQDPRAVARLAARYRVPVLAVHAPCLAVSQRVWASDPITRIRRAAEVAHDLDARTVVVHPPFRWQRRYVRAFADELDQAQQRTGVTIAVENMFPVRRAGLMLTPFAPDHDPTATGHPRYTLDLSHTAAAGVDALELMDRMAVGPGGGLVHVHLTDGSGASCDEHLVPGRGTQPCAEVCERLIERGFTGTVVVEISTKRARLRTVRASLLAESLAFARLHLLPASAPVAGPQAPLT